MGLERNAILRVGGWWTTLGWLSKCRGILVRYEKKARNYLAMLQLACALIWYLRWYQLEVLRWLLTWDRLKHNRVQHVVAGGCIANSSLPAH